MYVKCNCVSIFKGRTVLKDTCLTVFEIRSAMSDRPLLKTNTLPDIENNWSLICDANQEPRAWMSQTSCLPPVLFARCSGRGARNHCRPCEGRLERHKVTDSTGTRTGVLTPEGAVQAKAEFCGQTATSAQAKQKESAKNDLGLLFS